MIEYIEYIKYIALIHFIIGIIIGIYVTNHEFDKNDYIWNTEHGVDWGAVLINIPSMLIFIIFMGFAWGGFLLLFILNWLGLLPDSGERQRY